MKTLGKIFCALSFFSAGLVTAAETEITVTSFNIKLYGQKTELSSEWTASQRDRALSAFLKNDVPASDVYIFEEIMNKEEFTKNVVKDLKCVSYDNARTEHQYVLICARSEYDLKVDAQVDNNYAIEEVALGSSGQRPAVHALLTNKKGETLLRVVGVHLSAFPANTANRIKQADLIRKHLKKADDKIPTIISGDFNTYPAQLTGLAHSDVELISEAFRQDNGSIKMPAHPSPFTFRTPEYRSKFDHFWKSESLSPVGQVKVTGYCNDPDVVNANPDYYELISDHCPVTLKVKLPALK